MASKVRVFVAVPSVGEWSDLLPHQLRKIEKKYEDRIEFIWPANLTRRMFHDFARNALVDEFLATDADILWFIDSDVSPPENVLDLITEHGDKWQAAGAPYPVFMTPTGEEHASVVYTVYNGIKNGGMAPSDVPSTGTDFVDGIATGCLLLRREVFAKLKAPFFHFSFNEENRGLSCGEDINFCLKMAEQGIKFFIDYSMLCKHSKRVDLLDVNNYAVWFARKSIEKFKEQIAPEMDAVMQTAYKKGIEVGQRKARQGSGIILSSR